MAGVEGCVVLGWRDYWEETIRPRVPETDRIVTDTMIGVAILLGNTGKCSCEICQFVAYAVKGPQFALAGPIMDQPGRHLTKCSGKDGNGRPVPCLHDEMAIMLP